MTVRDRRVERGTAIARDLSEVARREIRRARVSAGLSRADVARAVGVSASQVDRFERGDLIDVRLEQICRLAFAVGLSTSLRFFPDADPVRDAGQLRVLERLRARLPSSVTLRTEVPLDRQNDRRAWDAVTVWSDCVDAFEIETRLADIQAVERRVMLKSRDDGVVRHVFLVVADTRANRVALAAGRRALSANFPLDTRPVLASLAAGRCPGSNGLVVL